MNLFWQLENFYTNMRIESHHGQDIIVMNTAIGHTYGAGVKMFYDEHCDWVFDWKFIDKKEEREARLNSALFGSQRRRRR
jgi:hypothetical protein